MIGTPFWSFRLIKPFCCWDMVQASSGVRKRSKLDAGNCPGSNVRLNQNLDAVGCLKHYLIVRLAKITSLIISGHANTESLETYIQYGANQQ
jgi:hypothetical protein